MRNMISVLVLLVLVCLDPYKIIPAVAAGSCESQSACKLIYRLSNGISYTDSYAGVIEPPIPVNASLGSTAEFNCTARGDAFTWLVDGKSAKFQNIADRGVRVSPIIDIAPGIIFATLSISASNDNNNTQVQCIAVHLGSLVFDDSSGPVTLLVQGSTIVIVIQYHTSM